jgi:hypothetical protein
VTACVARPEVSHAYSPAVSGSRGAWNWPDVEMSRSAWSMSPDTSSTSQRWRRGVRGGDARQEAFVRRELILRGVGFQVREHGSRVWAERHRRREREVAELHRGVAMFVVVESYNGVAGGYASGVLGNLGKTLS